MAKEPATRAAARGRKADRDPSSCTCAILTSSVFPRVREMRCLTYPSASKAARACFLPGKDLFHGPPAAARRDGLGMADAENHHGHGLGPIPWATQLRTRLKSTGPRLSPFAPTAILALRPPTAPPGLNTLLPLRSLLSMVSPDSACPQIPRAWRRTRRARWRQEPRREAGPPSRWLLQLCN